MDAVERDIYYYLKYRSAQWIPFQEISRRTGGKRRFRRSPDWVKPVLLRMSERGIIENDGKACYRLKPVPESERWGKRWVSPLIAELLQKPGKEFTNVLTPDFEDKYYDKL